ncbi:MAG: hypothetical protein HC895_05280 [Leptolyngbyaceae cyanobacterium SM1_3_5]|nr:hypothetical protein [Leptolyngbyaceae cyanobacterium SM1_3_5]
MTSALSELLILGLQRVDAQTLRYWQELERQGKALGFVRLLKPIAQLVTALAQKTITLDWNGQAAAESMLAIALLVKLAQEQLSNDANSISTKNAGGVLTELDSSLSWTGSHGGAGRSSKP